MVKCVRHPSFEDELNVSQIITKKRVACYFTQCSSHSNEQIHLTSNNVCLSTSTKNVTMLLQNNPFFLDIFTPINRIVSYHLGYNRRTEKSYHLMDNKKSKFIYFSFS